MKEIMIATSNLHKAQEFQQILKPFGYHVKSLLDLEQKIEIEENGTTFAENAAIKAKAVYELLHIPVISDDSGLMVNAMHGEPGIHSARFMGYDTSYTIKNQAIIDEVNKSEDRGAQFVCAIAYVDEQGNLHTFEGKIEGTIASRIEGEKGFGYDPIFYYPPKQTTLAMLPAEEKNQISHRYRAIEKLLRYMEETSCCM